MREAGGVTAEETGVVCDVIVAIKPRPWPSCPPAACHRRHETARDHSTAARTAPISPEEKLIRRTSGTHFGFDAVTFTLPH